MTGCHQARRPRRTKWQRFLSAVSWPGPGGIAVSLAGAALVLAGAVGVDAGYPFAGTTPAPAQRAASRAASPATAVQVPDATAAGDTASSGPAATPATAAPPPPAPTPAAPLLVAGAAAGAPIQKLFATGTASPADRALWNVNNPASPLVLVNKAHPLNPTDYQPADLLTPSVASASAEPALLRREAAEAVERMFAAAAADGVAITIESSFRSYDTQVSLYGGYVTQKGEGAADTSSARPGFSEHQTGLALDIGDDNVPASCEFTACVAGTAAGRWVAAYGTAFGFVVRYPEGQQASTGYLYEPWHLRYVGIAVALDMGVRGIGTYEQYLGLPGAPGYK